MRPASDPLDVSVVLPVYRCAEQLEDLYVRLRTTLEANTVAFELVFVNDGSPDDAAGVLEALERRDRRVRVISLARNSGQQRAVMTGLGHARGHWIVVMDADLQDPPEAIPLLLASAREQHMPVVFAGRRGRYESTPRLLTSRAFKRSLAALAGLPPDAGLFVALERPVVDRVLELDGSRPFVTAMIAATGYPTASVPVPRATRPSGSSAYRSRDRVAAAARGLSWAVAWRLRGRRV